MRAGSRNSRIETPCAKRLKRQDSAPGSAIAKRGHGMAKTALPIQPPLVCIAHLSRKKQSEIWLLFLVLNSLLVAVHSACYNYSSSIILYVCGHVLGLLMP